jgi:hypothetical protein
MRSREELCSLLARLPQEDRIWLVSQLSPPERARLAEALSCPPEGLVDPEQVSFLARLLAQEPAWLQQAALASFPEAKRSQVFRALATELGGTVGYSDRTLSEAHLPSSWQDLLDEFLGTPSQTSPLYDPAQQGEIPVAHPRSGFERLVERFRGRGV